MANNEKLGAKKTENAQETESFGTRFINFFVKYQNVIYGIIIAILVIIAAIIALNKFYFTPKNHKASAAMLAPINYYMAGDSASLNLALEGDDENDGFLTIISDYVLQTSLDVNTIGIIVLGNSIVVIVITCKFLITNRRQCTKQVRQIHAKRKSLAKLEGITPV